MRIGILTISILIISVQMLVAVPVKGQSIKDVKIRIGLNNETLIQAFKKIESQSPFHFMYRNEEVGNIRNLNLPSSKGSVEEFLKTILSGTDLNYRQVNDQILIMLAKNPSPDSPVRMQQPP
ncbi:MAG TPA: STN domain-containing protein, partial [Puia sp.]|nr:STN domain-containing protein [Puia sp.]